MMNEEAILDTFSVYNNIVHYLDADLLKSSTVNVNTQAVLVV